jgi:class 3 adenylate cyclase
MIEGERKPATVLFCDMEDFTPLVEKLDTEEAYADLRGLQPYIPHLP